MNEPSATHPARDLRGLAPPVRAAVPPLVPVVLPLVVAAIGLSILFARLFPAGGERVPPQVRFTDVTAQSGLAFAPWRDASASPTTLGDAVVVLDYDNDGRPDLFFVTGTEWPWEESLVKSVSRGSLGLFHNDGDGHFTDVTASAGLNVGLQGMSAAAGDFDNDGLTDLYVTCVGTNHLFRNRGGGRFEDVTEQAAVGGEDNTWSTGAVWIDIDGDGMLDLVVAHYARWPREVGLSNAFLIADVGRSYGAPTGFVSTFPSVYRNLGDGRFERLTDDAGLRDIDNTTGLPAAYALAVVPVDANGDSRPDLLFSYHTSPSTLFINEGSGRFHKWAGTGGNRPEGASAEFASPSAPSFASAVNGDNRFQAFQAASGLGATNVDGAPANLASKLGIAVSDLDLAGSWEIVSGQGRAERAVNKFDTGRDFATAPRVYWNDGQSWEPVSPAEEGSWSAPLEARGIAVADFDGDGDSDVVISQSGGPPRMLRNDQRLGLPWLQIRLATTQGARSGVGARVEVHTPRRTMVQTMAPAMGLFAQSDSTLTFGLGDDARVQRIVVRWPDGTRQELKPDGLNRMLTIHEP